MKFLDLQAQYKGIKKEIDSAMQRVMDSGVFVGKDEKEVGVFENDMAKFFATKYAIGVNSGTDALALSLRALGIGQGDEVITTPFTFIATASTISNNGARPVFVDIDSKTFNINASKIEQVITKRTKAIIPVHLFGRLADMDAILNIAKKHRLFVIEDAAQAFGGEWKKKKAGTLGHAGCFSFFPSKNLGAYGDGGMVVTNNRRLADKIKLLRNHGSSPKKKYRHLVIGKNSRLDALQAAVLRVKLRHLSKWNKTRAQKAQYYSRRLRNLNGIETPMVQGEKAHVFHQYTIRVKYAKRDKLQQHLQKHNIPSLIYYPAPLHLQPALRYLKYKKGNFPEAEKASKEVLSLPLYPELSRRDQDLVIKSIRKFFSKK